MLVIFYCLSYIKHSSKCNKWSWHWMLTNNCYLSCTLILCINLLTNATLWYKCTECKFLSKAQKFINVWYLNITSEPKYPEYLSSRNRKLPSYTRNIPWERTITTITRTYQIEYDIRSIQIITGTVSSGICSIKW